MTETLTLSWKHPIAVADLPAEGVDLELVPNAAVRAELARHVGVLEIPALAARLHVRPDGGGGAAVEGTLTATLRQTCVLTLEPFDNPLVESVSLRFAPAERVEPLAAGGNEIGEDDPPEPLVGGAFDLAAVVAEFLALATDPYPRKPGAVFVPPAAEESPAPSTFAALERLVGRGRARKG